MGLSEFCQPTHRHTDTDTQTQTQTDRQTQTHTQTHTHTLTRAPDFMNPLWLVVRVACDLVVAGIGARPDATLFADHLALEHGGVKVDAHLQSSDENVFAIGDVAAFPLQLEGGAFVRQEHVQHGARVHARACMCARVCVRARGSVENLPAHPLTCCCLLLAYSEDVCAPCCECAACQGRRRR